MKKEEPTKEEIVEAVGTAVLSLLDSLGIDEINAVMADNNNRRLTVILEPTDK